MERDGTTIVVDERYVRRMRRRCARRPPDDPPKEPDSNVIDLDNRIASIPGGLR
jgi:hypothetical protein